MQITQISQKNNGKRPFLIILQQTKKISHIIV